MRQIRCILVTRTLCTSCRLIKHADVGQKGWFINEADFPGKLTAYMWSACSSALPHKGVQIELITRIGYESRGSNWVASLMRGFVSWQIMLPPQIYPFTGQVLPVWFTSNANCFRLPHTTEDLRFEFRSSYLSPTLEWCRHTLSTTIITFARKNYINNLVI